MQVNRNTILILYSSKNVDPQCYCDTRVKSPCYDEQIIDLFKKRWNCIS